MKKATANQQREEFENFQRLTKNLLAVPKKEVDKKRDAYESKKKRESEKKG